MNAIGIASSSQIAADAGADIAVAGGNAVDAAIAAALVSMTTEPGVCSLGGGAYLTISPPDGEALTIDGNVEMPGRGLAAEELGRGTHEAVLQYGGGVTTVVGHGSIGTPGALSALHMAHSRFGRLPWRELFGPAIDWARDGFPLPQASYNYLKFAHESVYGWQAESHAALHDESGALLSHGDKVMVAGLADSLERIARVGAQDFYTGEIGAMIAADCRQHDGPLGRADLEAYTPVVRAPLTSRLGQWRISTNPPPAVGGATLTAMLMLLSRDAPRHDKPDPERRAAIARWVLTYRRENLDLADDIEKAANEMLEACGEDSVRAPSTVHTSAVDNGGLACALTASAGYGAGVISPGTGIWMNNCLGEIELNRRGLVPGPPGTRLVSNMAPCTAHGDNGALLAIGSPGADRITTALAQTLDNFITYGMDLKDAIDAPRLHIDMSGAEPRLHLEPGIEIEQYDLPRVEHGEHAMYFGGVGAAMMHANGDFEVAADPRRTGGRRIVFTPDDGATGP
ncbi:MAG: gamma-glutamyltransferase [Pseudomonadota bacterium]